VTQAFLADAIGISVIHLNRVLKELRTRGLLEFERGNVSIPDMKQLRQVADFEPLYLHLEPAL